jgi:proteasome beta subunit
MSATASGTHRVPEAEISALAQQVVAGRLENPGG